MMETTAGPRTHVDPPILVSSRKAAKRTGQLPTVSPRGENLEVRARAPIRRWR